MIFRLACKDYKVIRGESLSTQHNLMVSDIRINMEENK